ncbi:MAG: hypothetical protein ABSG72_18525 [Candidatus Sulfotelmatobacter sp.]|jgi:hypothetical protein
MARFLFCVLAVLLFASFSVAQSSDRVEVFGGYSYMNPEFTSTLSGGVSGWDISATAKLVRYVGVVADFSGFSPSGANPCGRGCSGGPSASYHTFMGGPQVSMRIGKIKPFAHFLIGATRGSLTHADEQFGGDFSLLTFGAGGGVDLGLNRWLAVRGQVDWLHIGPTISNNVFNSGEGSSVGNVARVSAGLVFRF